MSQVDEKEQHELLAARLSGQIQNRDQLRRKGRKRSNGRAPSTRSRARLVLPGQVEVVVSGAATIEGLIDHLSQALEAARRANKDGLSIRSFEACLRDRSRRGGA